MDLLWTCCKRINIQTEPFNKVAITPASQPDARDPCDFLKMTQNASIFSFSYPRDQFFFVTLNQIL